MQAERLPQFRFRVEVLAYLRANGERLTRDQRDELIRLHDRLPEHEESARLEKRRAVVEHDLIEAWKVARAGTEHQGEQERRMAAQVGKMLDPGGDPVASARAVARLYLEHGMRPVNRAFVGIASEGDFEASSPGERIWLLNFILGKPGKGA